MRTVDPMRSVDVGVPRRPCRPRRLLSHLDHLSLTPIHPPLTATVRMTSRLCSTRSACSPSCPTQSLPSAVPRVTSVQYPRRSKPPPATHHQHDARPQRPAPQRQRRSSIAHALFVSSPRPSTIFRALLSPPDEPTVMTPIAHAAAVPSRTPSPVPAKCHPPRATAAPRVGRLLAGERKSASLHALSIHTATAPYRFH
ncbi:hypothetical protein C8F04DRAFT_1405080 [Mycena alexandri]|uniref:Uncharacterized protein n=1 Tax=Mycena alexandri TaxID=1745969 RepID=A0AAD6S051_9AGAR|nr:hypothetical protein C8F04DRAFT_1405080 [Mycena alexandri]